MDKGTTISANHQLNGRKNSAGQQHLTNLLKAVRTQPAEGKPSVIVARLLTDAAQESGTPFLLKGNKVAISINNRKHTLTADALDWLINSTASKIRLKDLPITGDNLKHHISQLRHVIGKLHFSQSNKAA